MTVSPHAVTDRSKHRRKDTDSLTLSHTHYRTRIHQFPYAPVAPTVTTTTTATSLPFLNPFFSPHWINLRTATRMRVKAHLLHFVPFCQFALVCSTTNQRAWLFISLLSLFFCLKLLSLFFNRNRIFTLFILSFLDHVFSLFFGHGFLSYWPLDRPWDL